MSTRPGTMSAEDAASAFQLAYRAGHNYVYQRQWETFEKSLANPWTPEHPDGVVNLSVAENSLMHREIVEFTKKNFAVDPVHHLTYGSGPKGSRRLREALASFLNAHFQPHEAVRYEDILVQGGVTAVVDSLAWALCNEGEGIIVPHPYYLGFSIDIPTRARAVIIRAHFQTLEGYKGFDDVFDPAMNIRALEAALQGAQQRGIKVRAVLLCNPHNPLGRCYSADALRQIASFCGQHKLHFISDEIYAKSVFENPKAPDPIPFTSVLSLDLADRIDPRLVHVAYGASKDFCSNGLRLGMLHTRNQGLQAVITGTSMLGWPPYIVQDLWASMLENTEYTKNFMATNQRRLAAQHALATQFLDRHGIPYFRNSNAGMYLWVDLGRYVKRGAEVPTLSVHRLTPQAEEEYRGREMELGDRFSAAGVNIAAGASFCAEEIGWFRLTFSVSTEALETGLQRMIKVLHEMEAGWEGKGAVAGRAKL